MEKETVWNVKPVEQMNIVTVNAWQREHPREDMSYNEYLKAHFQEVKNEKKKK